MHLLIVMYKACKSLAQVVVVVPWYLPLRFGRAAEVPPGWIVWGRIPPGITNIFLKNHISVNS